MVIDGSDRSRSGSSNMCEAGDSGGIGTNAVEIAIVCRRLTVFVHSGPHSLTFVEVISGRRVPGHAKAIDVEKAVAHRDLMLGGDVVGVMGQQLREIVIVDLLGKRVSRPYENILEQTFF